MTYCKRQGGIPAFVPVRPALRRATGRLRPEFDTQTPPVTPKSLANFFTGLGVAGLLLVSNSQVTSEFLYRVGCWGSAAARRGARARHPNRSIALRRFLYGGGPVGESTYPAHAVLHRWHLPCTCGSPAVHMQCLCCSSTWLRPDRLRRLRLFPFRFHSIRPPATRSARVVPRRLPPMRPNPCQRPTPMTALFRSVVARAPSGRAYAFDINAG